LVEAGERVPIRLVQENGETISLDATSIDMVIEREQSTFGISLFDAKKMSIDLNQAMVGFEIQGVFTDDEGQEVSSKAKATIDFHHTQTLFDEDAAAAYAEANSGGKGNKRSASNKSMGAGSKITDPFKSRLKGKSNWEKWHNKHITLPVAYWVDQRKSTSASPLPVTSGLSARFDASALTASNLSSSTIQHEATVDSWTDSVNGLVANKNGTPKYKQHGINGRPYVEFDGSSRFDVSYNANLNPTNMTIFAVATTTSDNGAHQSIITSRETNEGYALYYNMTGSDNEVKFDVFDSGTTTIESGNGTVSPNVPNIISQRVTNTGSSKFQFLNGIHKGNGSGTYNNSDAATTFIGAGSTDGSQYKFVGHIYEIIIYNRILSADEQQQVEGYLSSKYNIPIYDIAGFANHPYRNFSYQDYPSNVKVVFDATRVASKNEPYGYVNKVRRMTDIVVAAGSSSNALGTVTVNVSGGDARDWIELTNSSADYHIKLKDPTDGTGGFRGNSYGDALLKVTAVAESSITCVVEGGNGSTIAQSDEVYLAPSLNLGEENVSPLMGNPVVVLPIENAFATISAFGQTLPYVNYPAYQDTSSRTEGLSQIPTRSGIPEPGKRADEYITYQLSQLLTSTLEISERAVNAAGDKTLNKVFTTAIKVGSNDYETKLEITQVYATSLGTVNSQINHNFSVGNLPNIQGFTGGKAGKKVKSAGDKAQDLLGILANSNNFHTAETSGMGEFIQGIVSTFTQQVAYDEVESGDYITAIQIPYNTMVTKGDHELDEVVAQRNFFVTNSNVSTVSKMSSSNTTHASESYNTALNNSRRNGIHGIVTDFHIHRDAEMKAYEFALKFIAADIIL